MIVRVEVFDYDLSVIGRECPEEHLQQHHFKMSTKLIEQADQIVYVSDNGFKKVLKDRYVNIHSTK